MDFRLTQCFVCLLLIATTNAVINSGASDEKSPTRRDASLGVPSDSYGAPPPSFGANQANYGPPQAYVSSDLKAPNINYGPPSNSYGPPKSTYGLPKPSFKPLKPDYGPPLQDSYGLPPKPVYGAPQTPNSVYGLPSGPPSSSYGVPSVSYAKGPPGVPSPPTPPHISYHGWQPIPGVSIPYVQKNNGYEQSSLGTAYGPPLPQEGGCCNNNINSIDTSYGGLPPPILPASNLDYGPPKDENSYHGSSHAQSLTSLYKPPPIIPDTSYGPPTPSKQPSDSYGPPPSGSYGPPPKEPHGSPPSGSYGPPPKDSYGPPPKDSYGPPPSGSYGPPPKEPHGSPPSGSYGPPPKDSYGPPPKDSYGPPPSGSYGPPPKDSYGPPPSGSYGPPPKDSYGPPPKDSYGPPPSGSYGPPPKESHGPPPSGSYGPPPKDSYGPPPKDSYGPPPSGSYGPPPSGSYGPPSKESHGSPPSGSYGPPPKDSYGPPPKDSYGPPPSGSYGPPPSGSYGPPPKDSYGPPPKDSYGPPPSGSYGPPPTGSYGPPPKSTYGPPPSGSYGPPPTGSYGPPPKNSYGPPPSGSYGSPSKPSYHPPQKESHGPPPSGSYGPPPIGSYGPPPKSSYRPKPSGSYGPPPTDSYGPPPKDSYGPPKESYGQPSTGSFGPPKESYGLPSKPAYNSPPPKDSYGIPSLGFIDNSLQIQYGSPSTSSYNGLPPEGTFGTPIAICCGTPPPDLALQKPTDSQYGLTYGQASGRQIPGPNLQPKNPVKNRAPVPQGLVESTQYNSFQGEPYIPPPVPEVPTAVNDAYAAQSSSTGYSNSNSNPNLEQSQIVSQDQQQYKIPATQDVSNNGLYNQGSSTSYALPAPESYQHITQTVSLNNAIQEPNSYVQPNQLSLSNVENYGSPQQAFDLNQQIEENKNNPQSRDVENNSQQPGNNNYQHQPDGVDVNDIVKSLGLEGSSVVGSKSVDINGIQEYPVQGSNGNYMLQIQPGQGGGEHVAHDQVLSNGLLQDILSAIENQQKSDNSYDNQPQGSEVQQVATSAANTSTEWPENSASKKQEMALFYSTRDGKGQSTRGTETLPDEINHLSVNEVSNGNFVSYKSPKVNYVYSDSSPQSVSQAYPQQSTPKTDESSTNSLSSTGK
ncbi:extensin-like isoform X2 [Melanaphis sacchari]|uniref:extensin-like isoform X2 n=1 Tax=Melanaphis sacchari TaxID=742174 RepID=UPI000DC148EC|nr:extensin-like isoform X2 [Melanaphis sacchari]